MKNSLMHAFFQITLETILLQYLYIQHADGSQLPFILQFVYSGCFSFSFTIL